MQKILLSLILALAIVNVSGKAGKNKSKDTVHKIVFQLNTNDTMAHKSLMKQLNNITSVAPSTKIEVVCHGPGLDMLVTDKSVVQEKIKQLKTIGVDFVACEFSMKERNVAIEKIIPEAGFVKAGIIEIVSKQEQGWSYIKSGF
jgi:intracellular sulfur oxidation DsrE/DsrF family protein